LNLLEKMLAHLLSSRLRMSVAPLRLPFTQSPPEEIKVSRIEY
jgi:hypothetical protein